MIHLDAKRGLLEELLRLGFDVGRNALETTLFPHHVGHYIGVDLHDCQFFGKGRPLKAGQVVTIEPYA